MKRTAMQHTKMKKLMRKLELPQWGAVGILESLWHLTAREALMGDIGKLSDEDIAIGVDWKGEPQVLVDALVDAGWIDRSEKYRLVVHDWEEHADDATKKAIERHRKKLAENGGHLQTESDKNRLPLPLPLPEPKPEPLGETSPLDHSQVASAVIQQLAISGTDVLRNISDVCKSEMKLGKTPDYLLATMVGNFREFEKEKAAGHLAFPPGAAKFFGERLWQDKHLWPWKEGFAPPVPPPKRKYINDRGDAA